jgi:uncharacterized membrane protein YkvA (DUF1232 family)
MQVFVKLREWARRSKRDMAALYLAADDPRVPWYAKAVAAGVVAYALSPIDLIPDFIPVLGYLDDVIIVPLGIALAIRLIPEEVLNELRRAAEQAVSIRPGGLAGATFIVVVWLIALVLAAQWALDWYASSPSPDFPDRIRTAAVQP